MYLHSPHPHVHARRAGAPPARARRAPIIAPAALALALSACGGQPAPASAPAAPAPEAAPSDVPHTIRYARVVDLTQPLHEDIPIWPGGVPFRKIQLSGYDQGYLLHKFETGENSGTHLDAPAHFVEGTPTTETLPVEQLVAPAVVIDVRARAGADPDYQLTAGDVRAWEAEHGRIPAGALVLLATGWHERFGDPERYVNMDAEQVMHFPGFGPDSAELLVERDVAGIGTDTLSLDYGPSQDFATHRIMLAASKYQLENLANLDALPPTGATVVVGVLPVRGGSQAQARVLAFVP